MGAKVFVFGITFISTSFADLDPIFDVVVTCDSFFVVKVLLCGAHDERSANDLLNIGFKKSQIKLYKFGWNECDSFVNKAQSLAAIGQEEFVTTADVVILLGDRWELLPVAVSVFLSNIPICHLSGGEITEGAIDDVVRHSITKLSSLHFVANSECAENVCSLGEEDWRVSIIGEPGVEYCKNLDTTLTDSQLELFTPDFHRNDLILCTYHPCAFEEKSVEDVVKTISDVITKRNDLNFLITAPGMEIDAAYVRQKFSKFADAYQNVYYVERLGRELFVKMLAKAKVAFGNSSSFLIEAPVVKTPTLLLGKRQDGRMRGPSVYETKIDTKQILLTLSRMENDTEIVFKNPYDQVGDSVCGNFVKHLHRVLSSYNREELLMKKLVKREH